MNFVLLACVDNRPQLLKDCLRSLNYLDGWVPLIVGQEFSKQRQAEAVSVAPKQSQFLWLDKKVGMHNAKRIGLMSIESQANCYTVASIDDDMEILPLTDFDAMAKLAAKKDVGLISGNWVRSEKLLAKKSLENKTIRQNIVYTAGGLVFSEKIARKIIHLGQQDFWCDNTEWSLAAYTSGYKNYRYLGSLAVHKILSAGGRKSWVKSTKTKLPDESLIRLRASKDGGYHIPLSKDLTDIAKTLHENAAKKIAAQPWGKK